MRRFPSAVGRFLRRRLVCLALLVLSALLLSGSQTRFIFKEKILPPLTEWEVDPVYNNYIGGPITVVFRAYVPARAEVDLSLLPEVGETYDLWRVLPASSSGLGYDDNYSSTSDYANDGKLEVQDRVIREEFRGGQRVVEATFTFLYLDPISTESRFTRKMVRSPNIHIRYLRFDSRRREVVRDFVYTTTRQEAYFYLVRRVEEGDQPISTFMLVERHILPLPYLLKLSAAGLVVGMFAAQGWSVVRRRLLRRRGLGTVSSPSPKIGELYANWKAQGDYRYFLEAIRRYREGFWGKPRPLDWVRTTFILYSGRVISASQIKEIFEYLVSLDSEEV